MLFIIGVMFWIDVMGDGVGFKEEIWGWLVYLFLVVGWVFLNMVILVIIMIGFMCFVWNWMVIVGVFSYIV